MKTFFYILCILFFDGCASTQTSGLKTIELFCAKDEKTSRPIEPCEKRECEKDSAGVQKCNFMPGQNINDNPGIKVVLLGPVIEPKNLDLEKQRCEQRHSSGCISVIEGLRNSHASDEDIQPWIDKVCFFKHVICKVNGVTLSNTPTQIKNKKPKRTTTITTYRNSKIQTLQIFIY